MPKRSSNARKDANEIAKSVLDRLLGDAPEEPMPTTPDGKNAAAVALGRRGGLKGGKARAEALSPKKRSEIAKKAAKARWSGKSPK